MDQSNVEKLLRDIHVIIADGELVSGAPNKVIIEKQKLFDKLEDISSCMYELMDQYQVTQVSRDKAQARYKVQCKEIEEHATDRANDVYSASIMYTDEAIGRLSHLMEDMKTGIDVLMNQTQYAVDEQIAQVKSNKRELESQLYDMKDSNMYLNLVENRRRELERYEVENSIANELTGKKGMGRDGAQEHVPYVKTEVKINSDYFNKAKQTIEGFMAEPSEPKEVGAPDVQVNMQSPYFKWKKEQEQRKAQEQEESQESKLTISEAKASDTTTKNEE